MSQQPEVSKTVNVQRQRLSFGEQVIATFKILVLVAGVLGGIWLLDVIAG